MDENPNAHNGLITKIWGFFGWPFLHCITFGYPLKDPTQEQKNSYRTFFTEIGHVLPCRYCRESYQEFISEGDTKLTEDVFKNRDSLTYWFYLIHERVNNKLGVDYGLTYDDIKAKYESFRADCSHSTQYDKGCITPLDLKAQAFKKAYIKDCPIIHYDIAKQFIYYAKLRGIDETEFNYINKYKKDNEAATLKSKDTCNTFCKRNIECFEIIQNMRIEGKPSIEESGEWKVCLLLMN